MALTAWTEPLSAMIWLRISGVQRPRAMRSLRRYLFTTANSPARTRRVYMLDVKGSKDSLLPRIWAVEAVGMGARRREFRQPCSARSARSVDQSQRSDGWTPQRSGCSLPSDVGEPAYVA